MSNRIIISESQYSRLFLNEQFNSFTNPVTAQHPTFNKDATTGALNSDQIIKGFGLPDIKVNLKPGDMLMYRGCELEHWREPFKGKDCGQVFLHYNDSSGKDAKTNKFDGRPMIGLPSYFKK